MLAQYRKTVAAVVGVVLTWGGVAYVPDAHVSRSEMYALAVALATVLGVFAVPNDPPPVPAVPLAPVVPVVPIVPVAPVVLGEPVLPPLPET
jgi:hypothetical protein